MRYYPNIEYKMALSRILFYNLLILPLLISFILMGLDLISKYYYPLILLISIIILNLIVKQSPYNKLKQDIKKEN